MIAQILLAPKGTDAVALTAQEAIRTLLGYGDALQTLYRYQLLEVEADADRSVDLKSYLGRTFELWNSNKERCWLRTEGGQWEISPGSDPRPVPEVPGLSGPRVDHIVLWPRSDSSALGSAQEDAPMAGLGRPRDFPDGVSVRRSGIYTLVWSTDMAPAERDQRVEGVAAVRHRGEGLLVQPQYQAHRLFRSDLRLPLFASV